MGWSAPMNGPRTDIGFPRVIERTLLESGQQVVVRSITTGGDPTSSVVRNWERDVTAWSPDVIVYMVGHYETIHLLWPTWLERHANSYAWPPRTRSTLYRKHVLRPVWRALVKLQTKVDQKVPRLGRRRLRHAAADVERAIALVRQIASPLVIVMEIPSPGPHAVRLFPGMPGRVADLNAAFARVVTSRCEEDVRLFPSNAVIEEFSDDRDAALPDGFHFSPALHDVVGRRLADEIGAWAATQEHLKRPE